MVTGLVISTTEQGGPPRTASRTRLEVRMIHDTNRRTMRRRGGFTLTECMIAAAVLMAAVAGLVMPFSVAAKAQRLDALQTSAATLAGQMMERLQTMADAIGHGAPP